MMEIRRFGLGSAMAQSLVCALVVMSVSASTVPLATRTAAAQSDPRIAYPGPGMTLPGPDVPVVVSGAPADDDTEYQVSLDGVVVGTSASNSLVLNDVEPGDHQIAVQELSSDGSPRPDVDETGVTITVLPTATAAIHQGICDGFNHDPVEELGTVSLIEPLVVEVGGPRAGRPVGVPLAVPVASAEAMLDVPFNSFVDRAHVVTISVESPESPDAAIIVCGEIGGMSKNGAIRFGLDSRGDAEAFGVGSLTEAGNQTRVIIELVQSGAAPLALDRESVLPDGAGPLPVEIRQGVCAGLGREASFELEPLAPIPAGQGPDGDTSRGVVLAAPVISSDTVIEGSLDDLLIRAHAIGIRASGLDGVEDDTLVACGELGGPAFGGKLRVGLLAANLSGYVGVATLTDNEGGIEVLIELVHGSSEAAGPEQTVAPATTDADPTAGEPEVEEVIPEEPIVEPPPVEPDDPEVPVDPPTDPTAVPEVPTEVPTVPTEVPPTEAPATEAPATEPVPPTEAEPTDTPSSEAPTIEVLASDTPMSQETSEAQDPQS